MKNVKKFLLIINHSMMKVWYQKLDIKSAMEAKLIVGTSLIYQNYRVLVSDDIKYRNYKSINLSEDYVLRRMEDIKQFFMK